MPAPSARGRTHRFYARCILCGRGYWQDEAVGECVGGRAIGEGCGGMTLFAPRPLEFMNKTGGPVRTLGRKSVLAVKAELEAAGWKLDDAPVFHPQGPIWWGWTAAAKASWDRARAAEQTPA